MNKKTYEKTKYPCIYRHKESKKYAVDISKRINGKQVRTTKTGIVSEKEAREILKNADTILKQIYKQKYEKSTIKFSEQTRIIEFDFYLEDYFNHVMLEINNQNTMYKKRNKFNRYITPFFKNLKKDNNDPYDIREIDITIIERFKAYLNDYKTKDNKRLADDTRNTIFAQLSAYFNYLKNCLEIIEKNPCSNVKNFKISNKDIVYYTLEQIYKLLDTINEDNIKNLKIKLICKAIIQTFFFSGYRPSELFGLKINHFDYDLLNKSEIDKEYIKVKFENTLVYSKGGWMISRGKTNESLSTNYIGKNSMSALFEYIKYMHNNELVYEPDDYIFINPNTGKVYSLEYIRKQINYFMDKAGLPRLKLKDFRHSTGTLLLSNGYSLEEVKEKLRHTSIKTTEKHYATFYEDCKINIATGMDQFAKV